MTEPTTEEEWKRRINEKPPLPHHCIVCGHVAGRMQIAPFSLRCGSGFLVEDNSTCDEWVPPEGVSHD